MRIVHVFLASLAALAITTAPPALARNSNDPQTDSGPAPTHCHSLQAGPGGEWIEIPCQELGAPAQRPPKSSGRSAETGHKGASKHSPDEAEPNPGPS
jgi:hypothetical protein